jgi:hypothetical protein
VSRLAAALVALVMLAACMPSGGLPPVATSTVVPPTPAETQASAPSETLAPMPSLPPPPVLPSISFPPIVPLPSPSVSPSPAGEYRTLTGRVEDADPCPALLVGTQRWALVGGLSRTLIDGARVEVRGALVPAPPGCGGGRALHVTEARPR